MRVANLLGRSVLVSGAKALDIENASGGRFSSEPQAAYERWAELLEWAATFDVVEHPGSVTFDEASLFAPVPRPRQVFAVGLNYASHASESKLDVPENPLVFTKFPSSLTGPVTEVRLTGDRVDWEAELVVVIGAGGRDIPRAAGWDAVAGLTVGQDISDRTVQNWGNPPQFNLGKSGQGFSPIGPAIVSLDELTRSHDRNSLRITCHVVDTPGAERRSLQDGNTADLMFPIPDLVARLSAIVELYPGDLIFTGTPAGVGLGRDPQEFLVAGQTLITEIEGLGSLTQTIVS
ncbi:MAG: 2-keto-4-pentenoate hydratase/2-oxohepta-3-ene,7-dioic acid hydratase (Catechol pathway) [Microbacteriaceae bacterium]|nr:2-keto-4-pentenoate hydratase/2-oxohepta-3-ene,7-dioic acid hydratase (Catechol pathway) [Microbacteriaceae bacterium]